MPRTFAFVLLRGAVLTPRPPMELEIQKGIGRKQPPPGGYFAATSPAIGPDSHRGGAENLALEYAGKGVRVVSVRFAPSVHGAGDRGFLAALTAAARRHGVSAYVGDGTAAWSAVHRPAAARLVRLGLENAPAGSRLHAVAEEAVTTREIAL